MLYIFKNKVLDNNTVCVSGVQAHNTQIYATIPHQHKGTHVPLPQIIGPLLNLLPHPPPALEHQLETHLKFRSLKQEVISEQNTSSYILTNMAVSPYFCN